MNYPAIQNHETLKQAVDARTLWRELGSRKDFSDWVKAKVVNNPFFEEYIDYILLPQSVEQTGRGGHNRKDYALTLETAKKVAMAEQTAKGNDVRDYFIACEKKSQQTFAIPQSYSEALALAAEQARKIEQQQRSLENKDKLIMASNEASIKAGEILVREFAKSIDFIEVGQNKMFKWLRDQNYIMENKEPYQRYVQLGWFTWKPSDKEINGEYRYTLRITPRGKVSLTKRYWDWLEAHEMDAAA